MRKWIAILGAVALLAQPGPSAGSFETLVAVVQPIDGPGGLEPCVTTYSAYFLAEDEARALIMLTVAKNAIVMSSGVPQDRNQAVAAKIRFHATQQADTLIVSVDVSALDLPAIGSEQKGLRVYREQTFAMTLWCGLRNARAAWPKARVVEYRVDGNTDLERYTGFYSLEDVKPPVVAAAWDTSFGPR